MMMSIMMMMMISNATLVVRGRCSVFYLSQATFVAELSSVGADGQVAVRLSSRR